MQKSDCRHGQEGRQHNHCWNKDKDGKGDSQGSKCQWSKDSSEKKSGWGSSSHGHHHEHSHHHQHGHNHGNEHKSHEHQCSHVSKKN